MYIESRYDRGIKDTLAQVKALPEPETGETVFCKENGRVLTYDGELWMCDDFVKLTNGSTSTQPQGNVMVIPQGSGAGGTVIPTSNSYDTRVVGVNVYSTLGGAPMAIAYKGIYRVKLVYFSTPSAIGGFIRTTSAGGGGCAEINATVSAGFFGWTLQVPTVASPSLVRCLLRGKVEYYF
jgi:hypothetical protein